MTTLTMTTTIKVMKDKKRKIKIYGNDISFKAIIRLFSTG
jgi:hypothetical protein